MKRGRFINFVSLLVVFTFICTNCAFASGVSGYKLAAPPQVAGVSALAGRIQIPTELLQGVLDAKVTDLAALKLNADDIKKSIIDANKEAKAFIQESHLFLSSNKDGNVVIYLFNEKQPYLYRLTSRNTEVEDSFFTAFLHPVDRLGEILAIDQYNLEVYKVTNSFGINECLTTLYGRDIAIPAYVKRAPELKDTVKIAINNPESQEREIIRQYLLGNLIGIKIVGVNGVSPTNLYYLLTKDVSSTSSFNSWFGENFVVLDNGLGKKRPGSEPELVFPVTEIIKPDDFPWAEQKADVVIEGNNSALAENHIKKGAEFVIASHPVITAVTALMQILSVFSSDEIAGINFTDVQPPTFLQRGLDNSGTDPVLMRAQGVNIASSFAKDVHVALKKLLPPDLAKKIQGRIHFTPQAYGSLMNIQLVLKNGTTKDAINGRFKDAATSGNLAGKMLYSEDPSTVSMDIREEGRLVFQGNMTRVTRQGKIVQFLVWHNENNGFALTQLPELLSKLGQTGTPNIITGKDPAKIEKDTKDILDWVRTAPQKKGVLNKSAGYIPHPHNITRPKILDSGKEVVAGVNGPGRTGRTTIWAMQGNPNIDLRMINGASSSLILAWLLGADTIQQSIPKPVTSVILNYSQLKKEITLLLENYNPGHVKGFLEGLLASGKLVVLDDKEFNKTLSDLLGRWGCEDVDKGLERLKSRLVGILDLSGKKVLLTNERKAISELPWDVAGVKTVLECSGDLKNADEAGRHLTHIRGGRVIISAPAEGVAQSVVLGPVLPNRAGRINDNASCTTNCLVPVSRALSEVFELRGQVMLTDHAYTTDQDFGRQRPHKKESARGRDARQNILPASSGAAATAGKVMPFLAGASDGFAIRTPVPTASCIVLTATLKGNHTRQKIQGVLRTASETYLKGILAYTLEPVTSGLIIGNPSSSIIDGNSVRVVSYDPKTQETVITLEAWYDNEMGFSHRMVDHAVYTGGFGIVPGRVVADIGPKTQDLFYRQISETLNNGGTVIWNGPMGVIEAEPTSHGTEKVAKAIADTGSDVIKIVGGGDTLKSLPLEIRRKMTHVSTGGGAFLEAFEKGVENLPGLKALTDDTGKFYTLDDLLSKLNPGDTVLLRADFSVPLDSQGHITDNTRIAETIPTIQELLAKGVKLIIATHLQRPNGQYDPKLKTDPIADELRKLLSKTTVHKLDDCIGAPVRDFIQKIAKAGEIVLLENTRFRLAEEQNSQSFSSELASLAEYYVNDAFAVNHRAHASNVGVAKAKDFGKKFAGRLLEKEYEHLKKLRDNPTTPLVVVLGGGKVTDKMPIINALKNKAVKFLIGGRMAVAFLAANGIKVGDSDPDKQDIEMAENLLMDPDLKDKIVLPIDGIVVEDVSTGRNAEIVEGDVEPSDMRWFNRQFTEYLSAYLPQMTAEGRATAFYAEEPASPISRVVKDKEPVTILEAGLRNGELVDIKVLDSERAKAIDQELLTRTIAKIQEKRGLGITSGVDSIKIVDNLKEGAAEGKAPYSMVKDRALFLDIDSFQNANLLYLVLDHEFSEGVMAYIPHESSAIRELTTNYMSVKTALAEGITDIGDIIGLDPDNQFLELVRYIKAQKITEDSNIIALLLEHMRVTPYYQPLFAEFDVPSNIVEQVRTAQNKFEAALKVFNEIAQALTPRVKKVEADANRFTKMATKIRMVVSQLISKETGLVDTLLKTNKYIRLDVDRLEQNPELVGWLKGLLDKKETSPFIFYSGTGKDVSGFLTENNLKQADVVEITQANTITLIEPEKITADMPQNTLYLPLPYARSTVYLAFEVVSAEGVASGIDKLAKNTIESLYEALLGKEVTDTELEQLFKRPWTILPPIANITATLNAIRIAIAKIEAAA